MHAEAKPLRSQRAIRWVLFCESCVLIRRYRRQLITRETVAKVDIMNCWSDIKASSPQRLSSNCRASGILSAMETITRKPYETDLTDDEWAILEPVLKRALYGDKTKTRGHPRHYPLREITNAILYVLKTGCQWRNLPHDLPPWKTVYYHFRRWEKRGVLAQIRDTLVEQARAQAGKAAPKHLAVDSQSVPSTAKGGHAAMTGARR
jgi:putative transposase